jgi:hypothetical protein
MTGARLGRPPAWVRNLNEGIATARVAHEALLSRLLTWYESGPSKELRHLVDDAFAAHYDAIVEIWPYASDESGKRKRRSLNDDQRREVVERYTNGISTAALAAEFNCSQLTIQRTIKGGR